MQDIFSSEEGNEQQWLDDRSWRTTKDCKGEMLFELFFFPNYTLEHGKNLLLDELLLIKHFHVVCWE